MNPAAKTALLAFARELDRATELTKALLEDRGPGSPHVALAKAWTRLEAKMVAVQGRLP